MNWISVKNELPPENAIVNTNIHDERGLRNEQQLKRSGNLYWYPDGSMYVYYAPTHWAKLEAK